MIKLLNLQKKYNFRTLLVDSREELYKDSETIKIKDFQKEEQCNLEEYADELSDK